MDWQRFHQRHNINFNRNDVMHGLTCATIANSAMGSKGEFKPKMFMPYFREPELEDISQEEFVQQVQRSMKGILRQQ